MRIFVYEFVTGGGWFLVDGLSPPAGRLLREGLAMFRAVAEDFAALPDAEVVALWDARLPVSGPFAFYPAPVVDIAAHQAIFREAAATADYALVIAPEFNDYLLHACQTVVDSGGKLLGPDVEFVSLAADKHRTAKALAAASVRAPRGVALAAGESLPLGFPYPAVLKPRDGAGSVGVQLIASRDHARQLSPRQNPSRLEWHCPGTPVSVSALCSPRGNVLLPPMRQILSADGQFTYLGGDSRLSPIRQKRAHETARQSLAVLPATTGYVGIDLILGDDDSGADDVVIEVNPRLTTSYVGLRAIIRENLAGAILQLAAGGGIPDLSRRRGEVEFTADGEVTLIDDK